jgi:purine-binding chemotaxis protein CheW
MTTPGAPAPAAECQRGYGGFQLAGMPLVLPMAALREVLPCTSLLPLPCAAACVVGGLDLRGVVVPVVDLRCVLGRPQAPIAQPSVVIMVVDGRILGLLVEGVTGVFTAQAASLNRVQVAEPTAMVLAGSLRREDDGSLVNLLSPEALAALPGVPLVADPEPARQVAASDSAEVVINDRSVPMMLFRCGHVPLAVDAMAVHATLSNPVLERSVLTRGHCLGVLDYAGVKLPVVDLMALVGLGSLPAVAEPQAFVLRLEAGLVACLIHEVVDVVRTLPEDVLQVPAFAQPHPRLFAGALPLAAVPEEVVVRSGVTAQQFLLLDGRALHQEPELQALAATNTQGQTQASDTQGFASGAALSGGRSMITYALGGETATPIEQVAEILPYTRDISLFRERGPLLGMLVNRGRSIPVLCLSRLAGHGPIEATPAVSVLVVESEGERVGFAVPSLRNIEPAEWEPELPRQGRAGHDDLAAVLGERKLAMVGRGEGQRMLRLLDLQRLAGAVRGAQTLPG